MTEKPIFSGLGTCTLRPDDAYVAGFDDKGNVLIDADLANPAIVPTAVAEYYLDDELCRGVYHDDTDTWEIFQDKTFFTAAKAGSSHYRYCEETVAKFRNKLLAGPCPDSLSRRLSETMAKEINAEINRDVINSLLIASGQQPHQPPQPQIVLNVNPTVEQTRKLKAIWTLDKPEDMGLRTPTLVVISALFNKQSESATVGQGDVLKGHN